MLATSAVDIITHIAHSIAFDKIVQLRTLDPTTQNIPPTDVSEIAQSTIKTPLKVKEPGLTTHLLCVSDSPSSAHVQVAPYTVLLEFRYT